MPRFFNDEELRRRRAGLTPGPQVQPSGLSAQQVAVVDARIRANTAQELYNRYRREMTDRVRAGQASDQEQADYYSQYDVDAARRQLKQMQQGRETYMRSTRRGTGREEVLGRMDSDIGQLQREIGEASSWQKSMTDAGYQPGRDPKLEAMKRERILLQGLYQQQDESGRYGDALQTMERIRGLDEELKGYTAPSAADLSGVDWDTISTSDIVKLTGGKVDLSTVDVEAMKRRMDREKKENNLKIAGLETLYPEAYYQRGLQTLEGLDEETRQNVETLAAFRTTDKSSTFDVEPGSEGYTGPFDVDPSAYEEEPERQKARAALRQAGYSDEEINQLIDYRARQLNRESYESAVTGAAERAKESPFWESVGSVPLNMASGQGILNALAQKLTEPDRPIDYYHPAMVGSGMVNAIRGQVASDLADKHDREIAGVNAASFLYQTGMSMADSGVNMAMALAGMPEGVGLTMLGGSAATTAMQDAHRRGLSDGQAVGLGLIAGGAEIVTEKIGLDAFLDTAMGKGGKKAVTEIVKNVLAEGGEEVGSDIINLLADTVISREKSEWAQDVRHYMEYGSTAAQAFGKAVGGQLMSMGESFLGGALSGGVMGGGGLVYNNARARANYGADSAALVQEALELDPANQTAQQAQKRLEQGKKLSGDTLRQLVEMNEERIRSGETVEGTPFGMPVDGSDTIGQAEDGAKRTTTGWADEMGQAGRTMYGTVRELAAGLDEDSYRGLFGLAYEIGRQTVNQDAETGLAAAQERMAGQGLPEAVVESAYYAGREDVNFENQQAEGRQWTPSTQEEGSDGPIAELNEQEGETGHGTAEETGVRIRDGVRRTDSTDPGGQSSHVAEDAGETAKGRGDSGGAADRGAVGFRLAGEVRSSASLIGHSRGGTGDKLHLVVGGDSPAMQQARRQAKARGLTPYFYVGDYMHVDDVENRGYIRGNSVYIRADDPHYTADQIMRHEAGHDAIAKDEIDPAEVMDRLVEIYGEEALDAIAGRYARTYADSGMNADEIWEEIVCDSLGDMGVFARDLSAVAPEVDRVLKGFKDAAMENAMENAMERRGSRETDTGHKKTADRVEGGKMSRTGEDKYYKRRIDAWDGKDHGGAFRIGAISDPLREIGIPDADIWFDESKAAKQLAGKAEINKEILKAIPEVIANPIAISESYDNTAMIFGQLFDEGGRPVVIALRVSSTNRRNRITAVNKIRSIGVRTHNLDKLLSDDAILYLSKNRKETKDWFNALGRSTPFGGTKFGFIRSISFESGNNNPQNPDGKFSRVVETGDLKPLIETTKRSEREILAQALADGAASTQMEREWLSRYQRHAAELDRIQEQLNKERSLIHGNETGEAPLSREELQKATNRAEIYRKQLDREDGALADIKAMRPIRELLERQKAQSKRVITEAERAAKLASVQAAAMKERAAYWERQTRVTDLPTMRKEDVRKLVNGTIRAFQGKVKAEDVLETVQRAADTFAISRESEFALEQARRAMRPAARKIVESAMATANEEAAAEGREIREHLRHTTMELTPEIRDQMPDWRTWRKKFGSRIPMAEGGTPVDVAYQELSERFGYGWFPADIINPADQLERIGEVLDQTVDKQENPHGKDLEAATESCLDALVSGLVDESMRLTAPTIADRWAARLEKATREARESREEALRRAREGREDTERRQAMRMRIAVMVRSLDRQFRNPTDGRHIPDALRPTVLELCSIFTGNRIDSVQQGQKITVDDHAIFSKDALQQARHAYEELQKNEEGLGDLYDEQVAEDLRRLEETVTGRRLSELSYEELQEVSRIVDHVRFLARTVNEIFINGRKLQIDMVARGFISNAAMKGSKWTMAGSGTWGDAAARMLVTGNLKPEYFFRSLEDDTMSDLWSDMMAGQSTYGLHMREAREFKDDLMRRLDVKKWMDSKKVLSIRDAAGHPMELTMQQAMSLLAAYKREQTNQATNHVLGGGFVFRDGVSREKTVFGRRVPLLKEYKADTTPHTLTEDIIRDVALWLEKQDARSLEYVDEMVRYLSRDMAALGNETSMRLHGYRKFGEGYYFPMQSEKAFLEQQFDKAGEANRNFRNKGFTKRTVADANNPFVLRNFDEVWAEHVNQMLMYNALAVPQDNWNRMMNYRTTVDTEGHTPNNSVRAQFKETYGERAQQYFDTLMKDINGGITTDPRAGTVNRLISMWKKSAVFASMSVAIQQPSAIARAMAVMDPKYLAKTTLSRRDFRELQKWSGVAVIKSIGGFDTATGRTGAEWLLDDQGLREKIEGAMTVLPEKMDEITWAHLWNAVKAEIADTESFEVGSDEYFRRCAVRFEDVVERTQVYDSVMTRSENMRSKDAAVKVMTAFMAEPTVTLNMAMDAIANVKKHNTAENRRALTRTAVVLLASIIFNNALKAIVTAPRDKDKDKTYIEKYLTKFVGGVKDDVNPLGYFPVLKDIMELMEGYTVEASWTTVPKEFIKAVEGMKKEPTLGNGVDLAAAFTSLFGLPVKNLVRDARGVWNTAADMLPLSETDARGLKQAFEDGLGIDHSLKKYLKEAQEADRKGNETARKKALDEIRRQYDDKVRQFLRAGETRAEAEKKARKSMLSSVTSYLKPLYQAAETTREKERIKSLALRIYVGGHQLYNGYNWKNWAD